MLILVDNPEQRSRLIESIRCCMDDEIEQLRWRSAPAERPNARCGDCERLRRCSRGSKRSNLVNCGCFEPGYHPADERAPKI